MLWGIYSAICGEVNVSVEKCDEVKGDYVEKQQSCFISVTLKSWSGRKLLDPTRYEISSEVKRLSTVLYIIEKLIKAKRIIIIFTNINFSLTRQAQKWKFYKYIL